MQPTIQLSQIIKGRNPRTYFDPVEMESLARSIAEEGVIQPILIRPFNGKYQIVAGERRYRAAYSVFGEGYEMPVVIKEMTDEQADVAALVENIQRANMSPTEEAAGAAKLVGDLNGDRDEAAKRLGWSRAVLDRRLALMNCSESVRMALDKREILLGHAELLAALAKDTQDKFLPVIIKEKKTVTELKGTIEQAAAKLDSAIFDKQECNGCPHNSSVQTSMFDESITEGCCTNPTCYKEKTEVAVNLIAEGLKDEYPVIRIIRAGDNSTLVKLEADGDRGVGKDQAEACRTCTNFGAAVSSLPQALGKVYKNQCFSPSCNANKIAARIKVEADAKLATAPVVAKADGSKPLVKENMEKEQKEVKTVSVSEGEKIKAYREKVWRQAMKKEIGQSAELSKKYLLSLCLTSSARHINATSIGKAFETLTGHTSQSTNLGSNAALVNDVAPDVLEKLTTLLAASAMDNIDVHHLQQLAKYHQLDLTKHWSLDKDLFDLITKSEIEFIAKEIGLDLEFGEGFKKLFSEKKGDLVDKLLSIKTFNYSATIPKVIQF